jgi:putative FmdB family regulatory protein
MPLYEYRCTKCGHEMEVLQKFDDPPLRRCQKCRSKVEKLISRSSFQLKGGGWYDQGYGGSDSKKTTTSPKSDSPKSDSTKSDSPKSGKTKSDSSSSSTDKKAAGAGTS